MKPVRLEVGLYTVAHHCLLIVLLLLAVSSRAWAAEETNDHCTAVDQRLEILARTVTFAELDEMPRFVKIVRQRFQRMEMNPKRRAQLLAGLDEIEQSLTLGRPEPFGQAVTHFQEIMMGGNSLPPWDVECAVAFAQCVESGYPPEFCAIGFLLCLGFCEPADVLAEPATCSDPVNITLDVPVALVYAEVEPNQDCPPPAIGDAQAALLEAGRAICAQGECKTGSCVPKQTTTTTIRRQLSQFSRTTGGKKQCFVVVEAEYKSDCVCR